MKTKEEEREKRKKKKRGTSRATYPRTQNQLETSVPVIAI